nr:hypothetical protein BaRGS_006759 [Batillaria attramentaria]
MKAQLWCQGENHLTGQLSTQEEIQTAVLHPAVRQIRLVKQLDLCVWVLEEKEQETRGEARSLYLGDEDLSRLAVGLPDDGDLALGGFV